MKTNMRKHIKNNILHFVNIVFISILVLYHFSKLNYPAERRMNTMVSSNDGFVIAEVDMQLRGSGDIEGTAQSGDCIDFKIADLYKDVELLKIIRNQVQTILDVDCNLLLPDNSILHAEYKKREQSSVRWRDIS